jgi:hypothetical protein
VKLHRTLGAVLVLTACSLVQPPAGALPAQEPPPAKLSLRVVTFAGAAPTFYPLGDRDKSGAAAVIGGFRILSSPRLPGGPPVDTLVLNFSREGPGARVTVYVHRGGEQSRESIRVAEYLVGEGQEYVVARLAAYGVEPLRLSVVRRVGVELTPPRVVNRARAVEVGELKVRAEVPSFELVLRNASDKDVRAVEIEEYRGMMRKGPPPMYDWKTMPPLKPGETWKVTLEFGWNSKETPEGHVVEPPDRVVINSVLFADGSYKGDPLFAARAEAFRAGRRTQLGRVLELVRGAGWSPGPDAREAARELAARVELLECVAEWADVTELAGRYTFARGEELDRLKNQIEAGMRWQRSAVLGELRLFVAQAVPRSGEGGLRRWLEGWREKCEKSLAAI